MAKRPDPRPRIREIALQMYAQGDTPTPKLVREALGGGSPNIIVEVLHQLRTERNEQAARVTGIPVQKRPAVEALQNLGLQDVVELIGSAARTADALRDSVADVPRMLGTIERLLGEVTQLRADLKDARSEAASARAWFEAEVAKVEARYSGVQKHMLLQIEDARAASARTREELRAALDDRGVRDNQQKMIISELRNENSRLLGVIEELRRKVEAA